MAMNFRNANQFDPEDTDNENGGGLLGLLMAAMQQRQVPSTDNGQPSNDANNFGSAQGGLLARLAALPGERSSYQPPSAQSDGKTSIASPDSNFRQLVRVPNNLSEVNPSNGQLRPSYISLQGGADGRFSQEPSNSSPAQQLAMPSHGQCVDQCIHLLRSPSGDLQSSEYRACYRRCMGRLK